MSKYTKCGDIKYRIIDHNYNDSLQSELHEVLTNLEKELDKNLHNKSILKKIDDTMKVLETCRKVKEQTQPATETNRIISTAIYG